MSAGATAHGLRIYCDGAEDRRAIEALLDRYGLNEQVVLASVQTEGRAAVDLALRPDLAARWMPACDTTCLAATLQLDTGHDPAALEKEILLAWLASPISVPFPNAAEVLAGIHMRRNIVQAGRKTALAFATTSAERPNDCWHYDPERGFVVRSGHSLIEALRKATQPDVSGQMYDFSCYRATEYVILLGIAEELALCNPALLASLQSQCETRVIRSGQFHEVFLHEYGSQEAPLPAGYYVPGDRVWFRNPDERSSDVMGFEGSWVLYLGDGLFTNFWQRDQPFTLSAKCLEIYHWRHGVWRNGAGELAMDESIVHDRVAESLRDGAAAAQIVAEMMRLREPKGRYGHGGCIDTTREGPRWVCPGTADLVLPTQ